MSAVAPDHDKILRLAQIAFIASNNKALWKADAEAAVEAHGHACDALWAELERQVRLHLDPPSASAQFLPPWQTTP
jgi:hypothetical protein